MLSYMQSLISAACTHAFSAWTMLNHQDVSVSKLAAVFPEHAQKLTANPAVTARLDIEGDFVHSLTLFLHTVKCLHLLHV